MDDLTADRWQRLDGLLAEALARDPDARTAYLRAACGDDPALYREALALLASADEAVRALGESAADFASPLLEDDGEDGLAAGARVGPYRIEVEAGRGGMGVVYRAARADGAFEKRVALKLVKRGMDTDEVLARFRRERAVLAALDHPGIARLLDGGAAPDGRPYFAMELVEGEPLTAYCDRRRSSVEDRLALFAQVGEAVAYAHRRLVVHRDLKPSNVLVADGDGGPQTGGPQTGGPQTGGPDGRPRVKLLDFGIARLLGDATDEALTRTGARRLTPAYAAPEQARGEPATTAADVYALGVILYELLAGLRPTGAAAGAAPRPPSAVVTDAAADARGTSADALRRRLRGDLDVVCMTALREEPDARYPSVEALLDDLRRQREGLPLAARPASRAYRARKFVARHRAGVAAAALVVTALAAGLGAALWQARAAARQADRADRARDFALGLFSLADPDASQGEGLTTEGLLDQGAARARAELGDEPDVQADVLAALAAINYRLSRYDEAGALFERARALRAAHHGPASPEVALATAGLADVAVGQGDYGRADTLFRQALAVQRRSPRADPLARAATLYGWGALARAQDSLDAAEARHGEALALRRAHAGPASADVAESLKSLAHVQQQRGAYDAAEALYREALALQVRLTGEAHPEVGTISNSLASLLRTRGAYAEADQLYARALAVQRRLFPGDHRNLVATMANRGGLLVERGHPDEAEPLLREALAMAGRLFGDAHPSTALAQSNLGLALAERGRLGEAAALHEAALAVYRAGAGPTHPSTAVAFLNLGIDRLAEGRPAEAEGLLRQARAIAEAALPPDHPDRASTLLALGRAALARGRAAEATPLLRQALAIRRAALGEAHPHTDHARSWLGASLLAEGRPAEAEGLLAASARVLRREARRSTHEAVRAHLAAFSAATGHAPGGGPAASAGG